MTHKNQHKLKGDPVEATDADLGKLEDMMSDKNTAPKLGFFERLWAYFKHPKNVVREEKAISNTTRRNIRNLIGGPAKEIETSHEVYDFAKLRADYNKIVIAQRHSGLLLPDENIPSFEEVKAVFSQEMLEEVEDFHHPKLILITKGRSYNELQKRLFSAEPTKGIGTFPRVWVGAPPGGLGNVKPNKWSAYIVEGSAYVPEQEFDDGHLDLEERMCRFNDYKKNHNLVGGMNHLKFAHLMVQAECDNETEGKPWNTIMDEDKLSMYGDIPYASRVIKEHSFQYGWNKAGHPYPYMSFRRSVGGDVPSV